MHDAFTAVPVIPLPNTLAVEALTTWDDKIIVSTTKGLLIYQITGQSRVELLESKKSFSKKSVSQLEVIPELGILISLSDGMISVHDLVHFQLRCQLAKTRGASFFAVDVRQNPGRFAGNANANNAGGPSSSMASPSFSSKVGVQVRLCVVVKKKLMTFDWVENDFLDGKELNMPDVPKAIVWCDDSLCVGFKKEYDLIHLDSGSMKELFAVSLTNKSLEPIIKKVGNKELLLQQDQASFFIFYDGKASRKYAVKWSDIPSCVDIALPYVIAILPKHIEIRTVETQLMVQNIDAPKAFAIAQSRSIFVASSNVVWELIPVPFEIQIEKLIQQKEYEEAYNLAVRLTTLSEDDRKAKMQDIRKLHAYSLFAEYHFEQSMTLFSELDYDPTNVIGLFPGLLPEDIRKKLNHPIPPPKLERSDLDRAKTALIEFLTKKRHALLKNTTEKISPMEESTRKETSQIIDTTLLRCYLDTNAALAGPLLRVENYCHVGESEKMLKRHEKYAELVMLYQGKGLHRKALELLFKESQSPTSPLRGHMKTVRYLQKLGVEYLDLILEFSKFVLQSNPEDGLKIFTDDLKEVESLPHDKVLEHLERMEEKLAKQITSTSEGSGVVLFQESQLILPYLEHIIDVWNEKGVEFHNKRVLHYLNAVQSLRHEARVDGRNLSVPAGSEEGLLGVYRAKLLNFLQASKFYKPELMLSRFPINELLEERAILLGRLGRHESALSIYVVKLNDLAMAEEYCAQTYNRDNDKQKDVYLSLLKVYLRTPDVLGEEFLQGSAAVVPFIEPALNLLINHYNRIDTPKALDLLPSNVPIGGLYPFFEAVLRDRTNIRHYNQVLKNLFKAEQLQVQEQLIHYQTRRIILTDEKVCPVCNKRIANSVFVCYPNGDVVHYGCMKDRAVHL